MKKNTYSASIWQTYPFSLDIVAQWEKEQTSKNTQKKEKRTRLKLAFGW